MLEECFTLDIKVIKNISKIHKLFFNNLYLKY